MATTWTPQPMPAQPPTQPSAQPLAPWSDAWLTADDARAWRA